jgi:hypothetical protein
MVLFRDNLLKFLGVKIIFVAKTNNFYYFRVEKNIIKQNKTIPEKWKIIQ